MSVAEQVESFSRDLPRVFAGVIQPVLVGAGGRAHVFRVERPSPISPDTRETVAIKVFGLHALAPAEVERHFESEKKALARLRRLTDGSDDVRVMRLVRFHETLRGTWRDRPVFAFVGEYFRDGTLSRWRQQRDRVSLPQLQSLLRDIADALQFLHERGEVHQDVKPDNIFVVETDHAPDAPDRPRARIGDFGCTRPDGVLTESRTPLFAPDIGEPLDSGGRYDVFALGCVLAFLIKGKLEVADRRFGRMSPLVLEPARARAVVVGADDRWYRDATALLQDATRQDPARRPDARQLADRFDRICEANQRRADRRAARGAMWRDAVIPMWPSWAAIALLVVLTIVAAIARDARSWMPAGAETWSDDVIGVWRAADSRLLLADSRQPGRVRWSLRVPSPLLGHVELADSEMPLAIFGDDWIVWLDAAGGRMLRVVADDETGVQVRTRPPLTLAPPTGGSHLRPVPGGFIRWLDDGSVEFWSPRGDGGAWQVRRRPPVPAGAHDVRWDARRKVLVVELEGGHAIEQPGTE